MTDALDIAYFPEDDDDAKPYQDYVFSVSRKKVLRYLYSVSTPQTIFNILIQTNVSINILAAIYLNLANSQSNLIVFDNKGLQLTPQGKLWVFKNRKLIFLEIKQKKSIKKVSLDRLSNVKKLPVKYLLL